MKKLFNGKMILYLSLFSPLIDIITSFMLSNGINFTLGIMIKCIMLVLMVIYLLFIDRKNLFKNILFIGIVGIFNLISLYNNLGALSNIGFSYFSYLVKFDFSVISLFYFIRYFSNNKIEIKLLKIPIIILSISIVLSNLTATGFYTYDEHRVGTSSWFSSGNEFGALLSILYPIAIYLFLDRKDSKKIDIIYVLIISFGMINLGTKVGLLSFYISSLAYLFFRLINIKKYKLNYSFYVMSLLVVITSCLFNHLPTIVNVKSKYEYVKSNSVNVVEGDKTKAEVDAVTEVILSNRNKYLEYVMSNNYDMLDYFVGKINYTIDNDYVNLVIIEMDLFDTFYMFGIFGFVLLYGLVGYVGCKIFLKYLKDMKHGIKYIKINMLLICLGLTFIISCLVGHVMFCPSVSLYFVLICAYLFAYDKFEKDENDKIKLLIGTVHMKVGGIEKTLINLLNMIDYDKYEVDLLLQLKNGSYYEQIPSNVKVITPYSSIFDGFFARESKISKIIKHLLYNKNTAWFWTNNKRYDVAIDYSGYYLFIDYYIANSNSSKKYIWVHQSVYGSLEYSNNFERNFMKNLNKYNKYNKIVCVSNSSKKEFNKMFPHLKDKTTVVLNLQDGNMKFTEDVKLNDGYNIISVGRLCAQKGFSRLVEVHKKLIDEGYKVNTYIIGNGECYNELNDLINEYGISGSFELLGQKSNVFDYLKKANLFVSTSYTEALPTVLLEALMCNLPWVGPNVTGVKDISSLSPKNSCILTEDNVDSIFEGVKDAINGKVNKDFNFDVEVYNNRAIKQFYKLIGE